MHITVSLLALLFSFTVPVWAAEPKSLVDLLNRVPEVPATAQDAATWFTPEAGKPGPGKLTHPDLLGLRGDLAASKGFSRFLRQTAAKTLSEDPTKKGLNESGIDAARLQRDPAYQAELQKRTERMTTQEKMAFAQRLMQAQLQATQQDARAMGQEPAEVEAAAEAATNYTVNYSTWLTGPLTTFTQEWEQAAQQLSQKPLAGKKPKMDWDSIGCEATCQREWQAYEQEIWPKVLSREADILKARRAVLLRYRAAVKERVQEGQLSLAPTGYGAAAQSQTNRATLATYHEQLLGDIEGYAAMVEQTALRPAMLVAQGSAKFVRGLP